MNLRFLLLTALGSVACAQLPEPLDYVQTFEPLEGKTLYLKQVACSAPGKPETLGRLYLSRLSDGRFQVARTEYNEQGKYVLDSGKNSPGVYKYYDRYVTQRQPLRAPTINAIIGLWKLFGTHFTLEKVTYSCRIS